MGSTRKTDLEALEAWAAFIARMAFALLGIAVVLFDVVAMKGQSDEIRGLFFLGGCAMMGPTVAAPLVSLIRSARGKG